jgi:hypothetical protein
MTVWAVTAIYQYFWIQSKGLCVPVVLNFLIGLSTSGLRKYVKRTIISSTLVRVIRASRLLVA